MARFGSKKYGEGGTRWGGFDPSRSWWRRTFMQGDNPMTWSVPIGRYFGITVRVSFIYILWMIISLVSHKRIGWEYELWSLGSLFMLVLLHEFGHCFACRRVGGEADEILMWMLGGLASCRPPHNWRASLITTIGGPGVNAVILPVLIGVMMGVGGVPIGALIFNPWGSGVGQAWLTAHNAMAAKGLPEWLIYGLFTLHMSNATLLLFNVFLVFFPFDGGRIVQELLWRKYGYTRSMWIATTVGLIGAAGLGLAALYFRDFQLFLIGAFGGFTCFQQRQHLKFIGEGMMTEERWAQWGADGESWKQGSRGATPRADKASQKRAEKAAKAAQAERDRAASESAELDRILAKIKDKGMASLSRSEEAFLRRSTQKSRDGS